MEFTKYTTSQGDRLDTIAAKVYGNPHRWSSIIEHNPNLDLDGVFEGGIDLKIEIISASETGLVNIDLPPWKR